MNCPLAGTLCWNHVPIILLCCQFEDQEVSLLEPTPCDNGAS